jgi:hypothetical protein
VEWAKQERWSQPGVEEKEVPTTKIKVLEKRGGGEQDEDRNGSLQPLPPSNLAQIFSLMIILTASDNGQDKHLQKWPAQPSGKPFVRIVQDPRKCLGHLAPKFSLRGALRRK